MSKFGVLIWIWEYESGIVSELVSPGKSERVERPTIGKVELALNWHAPPNSGQRSEAPRRGAGGAKH